MIDRIDPEYPPPIMEKITMADEPAYTDPTLSLDERIASADHAARYGDEVAIKWAHQLKVTKASQQPPNQSNWDPATAMTPDGTAENFEERRQQFLQGGANSLMQAFSPLSGEEDQPQPDPMPGITAGHDPVDLTTDRPMGIQERIAQGKAAWQAHQQAQINQAQQEAVDDVRQRLGKGPGEPLTEREARFAAAEAVLRQQESYPQGRPKAEAEGRWGDSLAMGVNQIPRREPGA